MPALFVSQLVLLFFLAISIVSEVGSIYGCFAELLKLSPHPC